MHVIEKEIEMHENEFIDVNSFAKLANIYVKSNTPDQQILNLSNNSIVCLSFLIS